MTQEAFKTWWYNEGSQAPYTHHDCEEHTMRMCEIAWNEAAQTLSQPEQEPVAWEQFHEHMAGPFYKAPPQRKPLNWEPIQEFWRNNSNIDWDELESAIKQAAHGIK